MTATQFHPEGVDLERLQQALNWIDEHPESWYQGAWRCDSGMCLAGIVAEQAGGQWLIPPEKLVNDVTHSDMLLTEPGDSADEIYSVFGTPVVTARSRAKALLGLNESGTDLFCADNLREDLEVMYQHLAAGGSQEELADLELPRFSDDEDER